MNNEELHTNVCDVAELINNSRIDNLLDLNWETVTDGFKEKRLKNLLSMVDSKYAKIKTVRSCLAYYEAYLIECQYEYYLECWEHRCQFKDFCTVKIREFEDYDEFLLNEKESKRNGQSVTIDKTALPDQLRTPYAKKLLDRLYPEYCDRNGKWRNNVKLSFICQVAHVLGGLTNIPISRKWVHFERMWNVSGLARAYVKLEGRPIDPVIRRMYPEYQAY